MIVKNVDSQKILCELVMIASTTTVVTCVHGQFMSVHGQFMGSLVDQHILMMFARSIAGNAFRATAPMR